MHYSDLQGISAARIVLNQFTRADIPFLIQYAGDKSIADTTLNIPHPYTEVEGLAWIKLCERNFAEKSAYSFAIRLKKGSNLIGGVGLKINKRFNNAELGYWIAKPFWNCGYATEAAKVAVEFGFDILHLHKIFATHLEINPASGKVMQHIAMVEEGKMKDHVYKNGKYHTLIQYGIISDRY